MDGREHRWMRTDHPAHTGLSGMQQRRLAGVRRLARLLNLQWRIGSFRFGLEAVIGLMPVAGDTVSLAAAVYEFLAAVQLRVPAWGLARMAVNSGIDLAVGTVPFAGDAFDVVFKAHARNLAIIEHYAGRREGAA